jgi:type II secretory pathway predicted ATPase ExeA
MTMLSGVMEYFGFRTSLKPVAYYDSEYHQQLLKDLKAAIHGGGLVAFTGIVGSGKTVLLARLQQQLRDEGQIEVCESLAFEVAKVTLTTLKLALY